MASLVQISKSTLLGFGLYQSYRNSRILHAGWHEQKSLCTVDYISNLALLTILAQDNVTAVWGSSLANRLSKLSYVSYALIPTLHYLSDNLEESRLREVVDFSYLHINDAAFLATAVHSLAALKFGYNAYGNLIHLFFTALSILEQGVFLMDPKQNQGILATMREGEIYRTYQPYVSKLSYYLGIPLQFFFKGVLGKVIALTTLFLRYAPTEYKAAFVPQEIKDQLEETLRQERAYGVTLSPKGEEFSRRWVLDSARFKAEYEKILEMGADATQKGCLDKKLQEIEQGLADTLFTHFKLTERHLEPIRIEDFFSNQTLSALEAQVQECIKKDGTLSPDEKQELETIAGKVKSIVGSASHETLRLEREKVVKSVFGALAQDWDKRKGPFIERKGDILCDAAISNTMKGLYFEYYPALKYGIDLETDESRILGKRLQTKVALIFQQYRDHGFAAGIQRWSDRLKEFVSGPALSAAEESKNRLYTQISDLSQITTKLWWSNLFQYVWKTVQGFFWQNFIHFMEGLGTNRHGVNLNMAIYGRGLGLSDYEEARFDMEKMLQQFSLNSDLLDEITPHVEEFCKLQILNLHSQIWYPALLENVLNPGDERLRDDHLLSYIRHRAKDFPDIQDLVQGEIDDYFYPPQEEVERVLLVSMYLPQLLQDLDFIQPR